MEGRAWKAGASIARYRGPTDAPGARGGASGGAAVVLVMEATAKTPAVTKNSPSSEANPRNILPLRKGCDIARRAGLRGRPSRNAMEWKVGRWRGGALNKRTILNRFKRSKRDIRVEIGLVRFAVMVYKKACARAPRRISRQRPSGKETHRYPATACTRRPVCSLVLPSSSCERLAYSCLGMNRPQAGGRLTPCFPFRFCPRGFYDCLKPSPR